MWYRTFTYHTPWQSPAGEFLTDLVDPEGNHIRSFHSRGMVASSRAMRFLDIVPIAGDGPKTVNLSEFADV